MTRTTAPTIRAIVGSEPNIVYFTIDDLEAITAAGYTNYAVFTDGSATGSFTEAGSAALVANQLGYAYVDVGGTASEYYKVCLFSTGTSSPGTSSYSAIVQSGSIAYYCTALDVRQELAAGASGDSAIGTHDDDILWDMCEEASRLIDDYKRVPHGEYIADTSTSARYYSGSGYTMQNIDYCTSVDAVAVEETDGTYTAWTADTDFYTWPYNASAIDEPVAALEVVHKSGSSKSVWNVGPRRIRVAAYWGLASTPPLPVRRAARIQVARWYKRAQQAWQDAAANPELGELVYVKDLDPDVARALKSVYPVQGAGI